MERAFKCDLCSKKFISRSKLNHHMGREHGQPGYLAKEQFECNVCGKEFTAKQNVIVHMRVHTGERPFQCKVDDCEMKLKTQTALNNHMRRHTGERPFKCTVGDCEMKFKQQSTLNGHIKFKHSEERPFECSLPDCKYGAKILSDLRSHMKKHSDDRPFACPNEGCEFRTKHKSDLTRHLTTVHSTAKAFPCSACDYKVTRKGDLKILIRRRHSTRGDDTKCSNLDYAEYLVRSPDLESLLNNQDEASSSQCEQSGREKTFGDANALCDPNKDANSEPGVVRPNQNSTSCSISTAEGFHISEAENRENIEPNNTNTNTSEFVKGFRTQLQPR